MLTVLLVTAEKCLILTDILSSVKALLPRKITHRTHPLVYECMYMLSDLLEDGVEVEVIWIPSHVELEVNEIVDTRARHASLNGAVFKRRLPPVDFQGLARSCFAERVAGEAGRCGHW
jgi:hypothetical protein